MTTKEYIVVFVAVVVIAIGSYFYFGSSKTQRPPTRACTEEAMICWDGSAVGRTGPNCEFAPCPPKNNTPSVGTEEDDAFKDWQIYKNSTYNFQIKFPEGWQASGKPVSNTFASFVDEPGSAENPDTIELGIRVIADKKYDTLTGYLAATDKANATGWEGKPAVSVAQEEAIKINGYNAVRREVYLNAAGFPAIETYIFKDKIIYKVSIYLFVGEIFPGRANLYNEILSTFKFI